MKMKLSNIVFDPAIYPREKISDFHVSRLLDAFDAGAKFPPPIIESKTNRIVDGAHRCEVYTRKGVEMINVIEKVYATEADLFADAVRLNVGHGQSLDQYTIRNAIIRLTSYGYTREQISEVVRMPGDRIEHIERGFASSHEDGTPVALKGGLNHMKGHTLSPAQLAVNKHYSGGKAVFMVRQLIALLENDMWPDQSRAFVVEMNTLVQLWTDLANRNSNAA